MAETTVSSGCLEYQDAPHWEKAFEQARDTHRAEIDTFLGQPTYWNVFYEADHKLLRIVDLGGIEFFCDKIDCSTDMRSLQQVCKTFMQSNDWITVYNLNGSILGMNDKLEEHMHVSITKLPSQSLSFPADPEKDVLLGKRENAYKVTRDPKNKDKYLNVETCNGKQIICSIPWPSTVGILHQIVNCKRDTLPNEYVTIHDMNGEILSKEIRLPGAAIIMITTVTQYSVAFPTFSELPSDGI